MAAEVAPKKGTIDSKVAVPLAKSPAQVAAEKAEDWKRQQVEAESKRKEQKTFITKKKAAEPVLQ